MSAVAIILAAGASRRMGRCKASLPWHNGQTLLDYQIAQFYQAGFQSLVVLSPQNACLQANLQTRPNRMSNCDEPPDPDMQNPDTQDSDAQDLDTQDSDAQDSDAQGSETYSSSTHDLNQFEKNASSERQRDRTAAPQFVINPNPAQGKTGSILTGLRAVPASISTLAISAVDQPRPAWIYQTLLQAHQQQQALITVPTHCDRTGHPALFHTSLRPRLRQIRDETLGLRAVMQEFHSQIQRIEIHHAVVLTDLNTPDAYTAAFNQEVYSNPA